MRSIFKMPSDDMAGDAKRRVPLPIDRKAKCEAFVEWLPTICPRAEANGRSLVNRRKAKCEAFFGMPSDDLPASGGERAQPCEQEEGKMRSICGMASDDMAGDAKRRVPLP